jgi:hypothetical protein
MWFLELVYGIHTASMYGSTAEEKSNKAYGVVFMLPGTPPREHRTLLASRQSSTGGGGFGGAEEQTS